MMDIFALPSGRSQVNRTGDPGLEGNVREYLSAVGSLRRASTVALGELQWRRKAQGSKS